MRRSWSARVAALAPGGRTRVACGAIEPGEIRVKDVGRFES
jgi:hypothetical protein